MIRVTFIWAALLTGLAAGAQNPATVRESKKQFTTYAFSDPDPIPQMGKIYPYYRFDGYTHQPTQKEWKVVELENDYIKVMVMPEIGGKIWAAWEKTTGRPFLYYNQVVKFRDVAMRGPWTSGGIEANYGIIGHTPNCATPVDYMIRQNDDGSASCFIGVLDLLTHTYWMIEINLPRDKAYFTTRSFWSNATPLEQPYYTWMNVGMPASGNLQFIYPGNRHIGHSGEYADWTLHHENGKDLSFYENNNFGGPKSYHIIGKRSDFFGAWYHQYNFGMARYALRDDKPGSKIWIWGLSRNGMIWEDLLTDHDGQYVEVQSGRLFNQASEGSNYTPFKQMGFAPHSTDTWTEYWYPVKGTGGFVKANEYGALNLRANTSFLKIDFSPVQRIDDELKVYEGEREIYKRRLRLDPLQVFSDSVAFTGNTDDLVVTLGDHKLRYHADPRHDILSRPVQLPEDFDWNSVFGLYSLGTEFIQQRTYTRAAEKLKAALAKDPYFLPALTDLAMIALRNLEYDSARDLTLRALSLDTYDPAANFYYGLANAALGKIHDAKDGFEIAALSPAYRGAAYTELSRIYAKEKDFVKAGHYASKALALNANNTLALQMLATFGRVGNTPDEGEAALKKLEALVPLSHFVRFETYQRRQTDALKKSFTDGITIDMPHETYLALADYYSTLGLDQDAFEVLSLAPPNPEVYYRMAWLQHRLPGGQEKTFIEKGNALSPLLVFPFRETSAEALAWVTTQTDDWKPKYFLGLIYWSRHQTDRAKQYFSQCGDPDFAPFHAARATLYNDEGYVDHVQRAAKLDPSQWRYGKMLVEHHIENGDYGEALNVANHYHKRFPGDFRISMLLAKALLLNNRYKETTTLLAKTTILPYEGATDGRRMYREAWLMQAIAQLKAKQYKKALTSIDKAKLWPEHLGAGKPYDDMLDIRVEQYLEALVYEKSNRGEQAREKLSAIIDRPQGRRHQIADLVTALAFRKSGQPEKGEQLLEVWLAEQPGNTMAQWANAVYAGEEVEDPRSVQDNFRIVRELINL